MAPNDREHQEALLKINEIHEIMAGANRWLRPEPHMIGIGIVVFLIPFAYFLSDKFTFGIDTLANQPQLAALVRVAVVVISLLLVVKFGPKREKPKVPLSQVIQKTFRFESTAAVAFALMAFAIVAIDLKQLLVPLACLIVGLSYNAISAHTTKLVYLASWGLIIAAPLLLILSYRLDDMSYSYWGGVCWLGLMLILIGISSLKTSKNLTGTEHGF